MKIKALVIAPYQGLAELTASLLDQLDDFDVTVIQRDLSESLRGSGLTRSRVTISS
ncbi:hypothetical protein LJK87_21525 [Paenibacillus sp. P25]|nr:hypothetical protein LJK87_21525 [Paenibacillus sp. P25]